MGVGRDERLQFAAQGGTIGNRKSGCKLAYSSKMIDIIFLIQRAENWLSSAASVIILPMFFAFS